jgi:hypothetical protein
MGGRNASDQRPYTKGTHHKDEGLTWPLVDLGKNFGSFSATPFAHCLLCSRSALISGKASAAEDEEEVVMVRDGVTNVEGVETRRAEEKGRVYGPSERARAGVKVG